MVRPHRRPGAERAIPTTRRHAREWAVQLLFALDAAVRGDTPSAASLDLPIVFEDFWEEQYRLRLEEQGLSDDETAAALLEDGWRDLVATRATRAFCEAIVEGVFLHLAEIDSAIERSSDHWALDRMGGVERSVLRMGAWELLFRSGEVPRAVAINEAVDVCKYFGMIQQLSHIPIAPERGKSIHKADPRSQRRLADIVLLCIGTEGNQLLSVCQHQHFCALSAQLFQAMIPKQLAEILPGTPVTFLYLVKPAALLTA